MIAHFDVDAFYASVAQHDDAQLRGKPLAIAGSGRRAVVLTASYEARAYGVRSAMPLFQALARCPELIVRPPNFERYQAVSRAVFGILTRGAQAVERLSLDEAFIDLPGATLEGAVAHANDARAEVRREVGLAVSAGVAAQKMIAKIACDDAKPDGLVWVSPGDEAQYIAALPVGRLWGIGPKSQARLRDAGVRTIGHVAALDDDAIVRLFGRFGFSLRELARGNDTRRVDSDDRTRSISSEETFEDDVAGLDALRGPLAELCADVSRRLRNHELRARTVGVKVKRSDFTITGRQVQLPAFTDEAEALYEAALRCLARVDFAGHAVRLLGVRVAGLATDAPLQMSLLS